MLIESFTGYSNLGWHLWSLSTCIASAHDLLAFIVSGEKFGVILIVLPVYVTWPFSSSAFNILSLFCAFDVLTIMWWEEFLFWSNIVGVLQASCMFMGISFFRLGKFSSMILLVLWVGSLHSLLYLSSLGLIFSLCPGFPVCFGPVAFSIFHYLWQLCWWFLWNLLLLRFSLLSLYSVGDVCICGSLSLLLVFYIQGCLPLCFLYCFYFHFQFLHLFDCIFL